MSPLVQVSHPQFWVLSPLQAVILLASAACLHPPAAPLPSAGGSV